MLKSNFRSGPMTNALDEKESGNDCCQPSLQKESLSFMKAVMDECTHMANFSGEFEFFAAEQNVSNQMCDSNVTSKDRGNEINEG